MTELEHLLRASILMEPQRQALKTLVALAKEATKESEDWEIWDSAIAAGEKALQPVVTAQEVIPMLVCPACSDPTPGLIDGLCLGCDELFNVSMACGLQLQEGVLQMPRRRAN